MAARVQLRAISNKEGNRTVADRATSSGSVVTWQRARIVLLAAQGMSPARISEVVFTAPHTVREPIQLQPRRLRRALPALSHCARRGGAPEHEGLS